MITHTMLVSFDQPLPESELDQYLGDIKEAMLNTGLTESFEARRHLPVPGEEEVPALIATVLVQIAVADLETLGKAFAAPELHTVIDKWKGRHSYRVAFANHESIA